MESRDCSTMVRLECANFKRGGCLFAGECPVMQGKRCSVSKAMLLGGSPDDEGQDYFSACVAPLIQIHPEYAAAAVEYAHIYGLKRPSIRHCACGSAISRSRQCCSRCRRKRASASQRAWRAHCREKLPFSLSQVLT
jgi:hypothetical protein